MNNRCWASVTVAMLSLVLVTGCGGSDVPKLTSVTGKVTLDGKPASGLVIDFSPQPPSESKGALLVGMGSTATTDANGEYELVYKGAGGTKGAVFGKHTVTINRGFAGGGPAGGIDGAAEQEPLPPQYNTETTLSANVKEGAENEFNFDLTSQ